jgi:rhodanese-related sulfurtransferase
MSKKKQKNKKVKQHKNSVINHNDQDLKTVSLRGASETSNEAISSVTRLPRSLQSLAMTRILIKRKVRAQIVRIKNNLSFWRPKGGQNLLWASYSKKMLDTASMTRWSFLIIFLIAFIAGFSFFVILSNNHSSRVIATKSHGVIAKSPQETEAISPTPSHNNIFSTIMQKFAKKDCFTCSTESFIYDPFILAQKIGKHDATITIVDVRSAQEFNKGHIRTAINIPSYTSLNAIEDTEVATGELVTSFQSLSGKQIIIYGSSAGSTIPSSLAAVLQKQNIHVHILGIGWNEWRHMKTIWVPQSAWDTFDVMQYVEENN